eukprot:jgi/Botrbrau1/14052/Bobra.0011s0018.1
MLSTVASVRPFGTQQLCTLRQARAPRRMVVVAVTDPQKVHEYKEKRRAENPIWQEPSNKNPLEKTTFTRESPIGSETGADENPIREITEEISGNANQAVDAIRDGIEGAGNAIKDAGAKIQEKIDDARGKA